MKTVSPVHALTAQLTLLRASGRWKMLLAGPILLLAAGAMMLRISGLVPEPGVMPVQFVMVSVHYTTLLLAALWGFAVWWREPPSQREHTLAQPVDISVQELARVGAGAVWVLATLGAMAVLAFGFHALHGSLGSAAMPTPVSWIALFTSPLLAYVLTATAATATRRSIEVVLVSLLAFYAVYILLAFTLMRSMNIQLFFTLHGLSLFNALFALHTTTSTIVYNEGGQAVTQTFTSAAGILEPTWISAAVFWWLIALGALAAVIWRRRSA